MKTIDNIFDKIVSLENLEEATRKAMKGKRKRDNVQYFILNNKDNKLLKELQQQLIQGTYKVSDYQCFVIYKPKERIISRLPFYPDRIVQHAVVNVLLDYWESLLHRNTFACVRNRGVLGKEGLHNAVKTELYNKERKWSYCLKMDIHHYYNNIDHDVLKNILSKQIKDQRTLLLLYKIIDSFHSDEGYYKGLPIGSILSQYISNIYLLRFDYNLKKHFKHVKFFRYNDDMIILSNNKEELHRVLDYTKNILSSKYKLQLKKNYQIFPIEKRGIDVGGFVYNKGWTLLRRRIKYNIIRKANKCNLRWGVKDIYNNCNKPFNIYFAGYKGLLQHCDSVHLVQKINHIPMNR